MTSGASHALSTWYSHLLSPSCDFVMYLSCFVQERCQAEASQERAATESLGKNASDARPNC